MDASDFRSDQHMAQQGCREKSRTQQISDNIPDYNWERSLVQNWGLNQDLSQVRNVRNAGSLHDATPNVSSRFIDFSSNPDLIPPAPVYQHHDHGANVVVGRQVEGEDSNLLMNPQPAITSSANFCAPTKISGCRDSWNPQLHSDSWMVNCGGDPACRVSNYNQDAIGIGEVLSNNAKAKNISIAFQWPKPSYYSRSRCLDVVVRSSLAMPYSEPSSRESHLAHSDLQFPSSSICRNETSAQNLVTVACSGTHRTRETHHGSWSGSRDELVLLPSFGENANALGADDCSAWLNQQVESLHHRWGGGEVGGVSTRNVDRDLRNFLHDPAKQGLSLSLFPNPSSNKHGGSQGSPAGVVFRESNDLNIAKSGYFSEMPKASVVIDRPNSGRCSQGLVVGASASHVQCHVGPLGPFTGYATILKSSRFLKPAHELLDEFCRSCNPRFLKDSNGLEGIKSEVSDLASMDVEGQVDTETKGDDTSGASSSNLSSANEVCGETFKPEFHRKKAKLLCLQDEVCRRYKLYHQQMQMVVSSFESVAGLGSATPYLCLALKRVLRSFRCLKDAIKDRLKHISKSLGDDNLSPKCHSNIISSKLKRRNGTSIQYGFQKQKAFGGSGVGLAEPQQQHIWRPQRGLPERAVAILRAWLFDHFLHPYPTDTDKQMLAAQTGLSRNQVSNWFINARVRVWKPMVEEIHMLETTGAAGREVSANASKTGEKTAENTRNVDPKDDPSGPERWIDHEKRSQVGLAAAGIDTAPLMMMGVVEKQSGVSLTLGLRHSAAAESSQQQQWQTTRSHGEDDPRQGQQHLGGQMVIHDHGHFIA